MTPTPQRRSLRLAALGFALIEGHGTPLRVLHSWLSTWTGIGHVIGGMHRQGYDVQLTQYNERGRVAGDVLRHRDGALRHKLHGVRVGADALARSATCGV
jgi:hypothetical protein